MSLRLLIDEDTQAKRLAKLLQQAGHDTLTINETISLIGAADPVVLDCARQERRLLLTQNTKDFAALHRFNSIHPGILVVYQESNTLKSMSFKQIVKAIHRYWLSASVLVYWESFG